MIDKEQLLTWLRDRATTQQALVGAVYQGLAERIERGQFDKEGEDRS